jgi:alpha-N-arabinofuranosidase
MPDQMHPKDAKENATLDGIRGKFGTDDDWTGGLLANAWGNFDGLSEHWYDRAEARAGAPAADELLEFARSPSNQVRMKAEEWAIYQQRFPAMKDKHVFLAIDEYAYFGAPANLKLSLAYAMVLQEMLRHTDFITMGAFTMGVSTLDVSPTDAVLNSTGEVFKLYGSAFGAGTLPIAVTGDSPQPEPRFQTGFDHTVVRAGSPTYPLDVVAGLAADRRSLRVAVVNPTFGTRRLAVDLRGMRSRGAGRAWVLAGPGLDAANSVGHPPAVTVRESAVPALARGLDVPATSVAIYEFPVAGGR